MFYSNLEDKGIHCCVIEKDGTGYGLKLTGANPVTVEHVHQNGPAQRVGVKIGDHIIKVNGTFVANCGHQEVVDLIRANSRVSLHVLSSGKDKDNANMDKEVSVPARRSSSNSNIVGAASPGQKATSESEIRENTKITAKKDPVTNPGAISASSDMLNSASSTGTAFRLDDVCIKLRKNEEPVKLSPELPVGFIAIENMMYQQPPKPAGSFSLMKELTKNNLSAPNPTVDTSSSPLLPTRNQQPMDSANVAAGQKQDLFKDFETVRQHPARMGVVLNYLLNKGEHNHAKYLLFCILVDHFKSTVNKSDVSQVTRRWAAEIYTSFLSNVSPLALRVPPNVLDPLTEKLRKPKNEKINWIELLEAVAQSLLNRCEKAVLEFRNIFNTGLSGIAGVLSVKPNMNAEATNSLLEPLFTKLMRKLAVNEELLSKDVYNTSQDGKIVMAQALRTALYFWGVTIRDQAPHCRVNESLASHSLVETILHRAQLSFNSAEELRGSGTDKRRNMPVVGGFFGKGKEKEKKKLRDSNQWMSHLFTETRIESLQHCAVCKKLLWGLPPQGWHCQHCTLTVHFGCKNSLEEECVNNKKEPSAPLANQSSESPNAGVTSKIKNKVIASQSVNLKDYRPQIDIVRNKEITPIRTQISVDPVCTEESNASNNSVDDSGYVQSIKAQFECGGENLVNDLHLIAHGTTLTNNFANPSSAALNELDKTKFGTVNRANSLRDEFSDTQKNHGLNPIVPPRANSDTPQHSNEIAQARREAELSTNVSTSSSDKSLAGTSTEDVNNQHSLTRASSSSLQQILHNSNLVGTETNPAAMAAASGGINEEELKNDEDLQLPSGLDEYKQRYNVDEKLKDMSKDFRDYQYHLHEIIATEMGHVRSLKILQVLYNRRWPPGELEFKLKIGLQHIEPCLEAHTSLMKKLEREVLKKQFLEGGNHTITDMFSVLLEWYSVPENVIKFKKYGASFGSRQADAPGQRNKNKPDTIFTEIEDSIRLAERRKTPFSRFLDQANKHPLMEKRRFQDIINIESQRQMRIYLLLSQASSKLKKVKDQSLIGKNEAANQKEVDRISHSVTSYLDKKAAMLKEYAKMDLTRYEPLDPCGIFSKENIVYGLHIMYLHREASVKVTSLHAPQRGRRKEQNMQLLWLDDSLFFINKDENTGIRCLKNIEASSAENPEQNMKASPVIQLCHVVTASCSQPPELKFFWYQPATELQNDIIHLAVSIVFDKSARAIEFKDALAKIPKPPLPRSNKMVGRSQSSTHLNSNRSFPSRSVSDVSGMYAANNIGSTTSLLSGLKELDKVEENFKPLESSVLEGAKILDDAVIARKALADAFYDQSRALSRLLRFDEQSDFEQICDMLIAKHEPLEDLADMLVVSHRHIYQISQNLSSAVCASGDVSQIACLKSFLRKIKRQSLTLHSTFQTVDLGEDSGEEEPFLETDFSDKNGKMLLVSNEQSSQLVEEISEPEDGGTLVDKELLPHEYESDYSLALNTSTCNDEDEGRTDAIEKEELGYEDGAKVATEPEDSSVSSDDKNDSSSESDDDSSSIDGSTTTSSEEDEEKGNPPEESIEFWEDLVCDMDPSKLDQLEQPALESLATSCDRELLHATDD